MPSKNMPVTQTYIYIYIGCYLLYGSVLVLCRLLTSNRCVAMINVKYYARCPDNHNHGFQWKCPTLQDYQTFHLMIVVNSPVSKEIVRLIDNIKVRLY